MLLVLEGATPFGAILINLIYIQLKSRAFDVTHHTMRYSGTEGFDNLPYLYKTVIAGHEFISPNSTSIFTSQLNFFEFHFESIAGVVKCFDYFLH